MVILLAGHSPLSQQLLITAIIAFGVVQLHPRLVDGRITHQQIVAGSGNACIRHLLPGQRIGQVGLGLRQTQTELRILYQQQRIPPADGLILVETYLPDKTLHASVDRRDVPAHLRIVSVLHPRMDKARTNIGQARQQQAYDNGVINKFLSLTCHVSHCF